MTRNSYDYINVEVLASQANHATLAKISHRYSRYVVAYRFQSMPLRFTPRNNFYVLLDPSLGCALSATTIARPQSKRHPRDNTSFDPIRPWSRVGQALIKYSVVMRFRVPSVSVIKGLNMFLSTHIHIIKTIICICWHEENKNSDTETEDEEFEVYT